MRDQGFLEMGGQCMCRRHKSKPSSILSLRISINGPPSSENKNDQSGIQSPEENLAGGLDSKTVVRDLSGIHLNSEG